VVHAGVTGDVMWNNRSQQGYLRLRGLAVNNPTAMQYQLWIFDKARETYSTNTAVDGGVFDVDTATGDVIVPIDAKLEIFEPTLFAVTAEPPGGVVVHEDDEARGYAIVLTASPVS
jgi:anti-sigma-K factor RskA